MPDNDFDLQLADALTERLVAFTDLPAKRQYQLILDRAKLKKGELVVTTFPYGGAIGVVDQEGNEETIDVGVAVQMAVDLANVEQIDGCVKAVRRIKDLFGVNGALRDVELAGCTWIGITNEPLWDPDRLQNGKEFLAIVIVSYRTDQ